MMRVKNVVSISFVLLVVISVTLYTNTAFAQTTSSQLLTTDYAKQKIFKSDTVVIYPIFTQAAYGIDGFYFYYSKLCNTKCLTVPIPTEKLPAYVSSEQAYLRLMSRSFEVLTDIDVDKNPGILKVYKNVIVLHNEYVTKKEFEAITSHSNVIYLYPNALYAQVKVDYGTGQVQLVRGHEYPLPTISNGFGWKFDNSRYEYNVQCSNSNFYRIANGWMLNCYPELVISNNMGLMDSLEEMVH
ncbi:MAG: hypothetical protein KGH99_01590 [Thaumarchaeota archaeon]|nr:hypothetical protein [Nitrososphaerota archaeon]MDE1872152.1 hypothetical protein [Nitrososphaerota archaeon]